MKLGFGSSAEKNGVPRIERVAPAAAIPGGEITVYGSGFTSRPGARPVVRFGEVEAPLSLASSTRLIARVPESAGGGTIQVVSAQNESQPFPVSIGFQIADNLHPVANPAVDAHGNIYVTFSGPRGQPVPVSLYKITANYSVKPFVTSLVNPSGLAVDRAGNLFVSCRNDGTIHRILRKAAPNSGSREWASPRASRSTATRIFMWATAAEPFSRSVRAARFLFLQPSSHRSPRIILRFIRAVICMSPDLRPPATTASIASRRAVKSVHSFAASDVRRG